MPEKRTASPSAAPGGGTSILIVIESFSTEPAIFAAETDQTTAKFRGGIDTSYGQAGGGDPGIEAKSVNDVGQYVGPSKAGARVESRYSSPCSSRAMDRVGWRDMSSLGSEVTGWNGVEWESGAVSGTKDSCEVCGLARGFWAEHMRSICCRSGPPHGSMR